MSDDSVFVEDIIEATENIELTKKEEKINAVNDCNVIFMEVNGKTVLVGNKNEDSLRKRISDKKIS